MKKISHILIAVLIVSLSTTSLCLGQDGLRAVRNSEQPIFPEELGSDAVSMLEWEWGKEESRVFVLDYQPFWKDCVQIPAGGLRISRNAAVYGVPLILHLGRSGNVLVFRPTQECGEVSNDVDSAMEVKPRFKLHIQSGGQHWGYLMHDAETDELVVIGDDIWLPTADIDFLAGKRQSDPEDLYPPQPEEGGECGVCP